MAQAGLYFQLCRKRQSDVKHCTISGLVLCPYLTIVRFDNGSGNGQADSHALRLCREKRLENLLDPVKGNAWTSVGYGNFGEMSACLVRTITLRSALGIFDITSIALTIRFKMTC